jgi:hypothetical protein
VALLDDRARQPGAARAATVAAPDSRSVGDGLIVIGTLPALAML